VTGYNSLGFDEFSHDGYFGSIIKGKIKEINIQMIKEEHESSDEEIQEEEKDKVEIDYTVYWLIIGSNYPTAKDYQRRNTNVNNGFLEDLNCISNILKENPLIK